MKLDLKIYRGYANEREIIVFGHVFKKYAPDVFDLDKSWYKHAWAVIRMFSIKTMANVPVKFQFNTISAETKTLKDGYFRFSIPHHQKLESGWHDFTISTETEDENIEETGEFIKPFLGGFGIISDIDDTFLVSHSRNIFMKIYVMLTKNVNKRHVFEGVVAHYRYLDHLGRDDKKTTNVFFYVSSSEWNLYNFIIQFTKLHKFPKAVLKLKNIKSGIADFLFTGDGNHEGKFDQIKHLIEFYPKLHFVLLGDDSQHDAFIYERICKIFPNNISAVYLRKTKKHSKSKLEKPIKSMEELGVGVCYFKNSSEAIQHSKKIVRKSKD